VFDLGAHHGVVALTLAREVGPDGRVIAVEGSQWNADVARWNAERNGVPNLNVVYSAVSDHEGTVRFADRASSNSNGRILDSDAVGSVEVPSTTVDKLAGLYGLPDVLYVDVEGFELAVLHGAEEALEGRPDLMIEVHVGCGLEAAGGSSDELLKLLTGLGYELWVHDEVDICVPEPIDRHPDIQRGRFFITAVADTSPAGSHASR